MEHCKDAKYAEGFVSSFKIGSHNTRTKVDAPAVVSNSPVLCNA